MLNKGPYLNNTSKHLINAELCKGEMKEPKLQHRDAFKQMELYKGLLIITIMVPRLRSPRQCTTDHGLPEGVPQNQTLFYTCRRYSQLQMHGRQHPSYLLIHVQDAQLL